MLLFGVSSLTYGGDQTSAILDKVVNVTALIGIPVMVLFYFDYPGVYKAAAWFLFLGVILLVLESMYEYGQPMYSFFVIKRFFFCGLALVAYSVASRAAPFKMEYAVRLIFIFYIINQVLLGKIFGYNFTSEGRTTAAPESLYLVIPFLYYLVRYLKERRVMHLLSSMAVFGLIVILLHRSVISTAVFAAAMVFGLAFVGKMPINNLPIGRTLLLLIGLMGLAVPFVSILPSSKIDSVAENIGGIFEPKKDETGSWRYEQSEYYMSQFPEKPLFGWRYEGYDRGEVMVNEDFPDKGTIIHSQYVDMLYNYGLAGLAITLLIMIGTLYVIYRRNRVFTLEQAVLFGFVGSALIYAVSYQLPVYFWGFVGVGMYYGRSQTAVPVKIDYTTINIQPEEPTEAIELSQNHITL